MSLEVEHCTMWGVYRADAEADLGPMAMFWSKEMAEDFVEQKHVPPDDRITVDLCILECRVEIIAWNSHDEPGEGRLDRAADLLHGAWHERQNLLDAEQD